MIEKLYKKISSGGKLTHAEKLFIKNETESLNLPINFGTKCKNCYSDALIMLMNIKRKEQFETGKRHSPILREPHGTHGLNFNGKVISNSNLDKRNIDFLVSMGFEHLIIK